MRRFDLQEVLVEAGFKMLEAQQLADAAGGNFTILRRRLAISADRPKWANDQDLAPLLLAAAWREDEGEDQQVISRLSSKPYADSDASLTKWSLEIDPPVRLVQGTWEFLSPVDAWEVLHFFLTSSHLDIFEKVAVEVLSEDDPSLQLPVSERFMASVKGKVWRFSKTLRHGIAVTLALGAAPNKRNRWWEKNSFWKSSRPNSPPIAATRLFVEAMGFARRSSATLAGSCP